MATIKRKLLRTRNGRFCEVEITLQDGRLSVCGTEGKILRRAAAKKEALAYWTSYFEEAKGEIQAMNERCGSRCITPRGAAKYVLQHDGELHGLDVHGPESGAEIRVAESCGQIRETIAEWFPEVVPLLAWHLNDMHAGCEHQEALGWGRGKTITLAAGSLTPAQREAIEHKASEVCKRAREKEYEKRLALLRSDQNYKVRWLKSILGRNLTIDEFHGPMKATRFLVALRAEVEKMITPEPFDAAIYKDSIGAPCPECGYCYGTAWLKRELPPEIVKLAETVAA